MLLILIKEHEAHKEATCRQLSVGVEVFLPMSTQVAQKLARANEDFLYMRTLMMRSARVGLEEA